MLISTVIGQTEMEIIVQSVPMAGFGSVKCLPSCEHMLSMFNGASHRILFELGEDKKLELLCRGIRSEPPVFPICDPWSCSTKQRD